MPFVVDTNVLVSYLFWPESPVRGVIEPLLRHGDVLRSTETFAELCEVVMRPKFDSYLSPAQRELFLAGFHDASRHVIITRRFQDCRDPKDNKFLELAFCGEAEMIVSGDTDLLALDPFHGIRIINPGGI